MTPQKISPHFYYHEFFSKGMRENNSVQFLQRLLDARLIPIMEKIRTELDSAVYVNNWYWGGNSMYRGFRPQNVSVGARYSQHKMGRAVDFHVANHTVEQVHAHILANETEFMQMGLTRLEDVRDAPTWTHLDLAWTGLDRIYVFRD